MCIRDSLYLTGGRHAWSSDEYDELVRKADSLGAVSYTHLASEQILYYPLKLESGTYMDYMQTIYNCLQGGSDFVQEPLMSFDKDLNAVPVGAESWEVSEDCLLYTSRCV